MTVVESCLQPEKEAVARALDFLLDSVQFLVYIPFTIALTLSLWPNWKSILKGVLELRYDFFNGFIETTSALFVGTHGYWLGGAMAWGVL